MIVYAIKNSENKFLTNTILVFGQASFKDEIPIFYYTKKEAETILPFLKDYKLKIVKIKVKIEEVEE